MLVHELNTDVNTADSLDNFKYSAKIFEVFLESESHSSSDAQENYVFPNNDKHDQSSGRTENKTIQFSDY